MIFQTAIAAIALSVLAAGVYLGWQGRKFIDRIEHLEQIAKRQRLPYPTSDGLEDITAILNDVRFQGDATDKLIVGLLNSQVMHVYKDSRIEHALKILHTLRKDPHGYNAETPNQKQEVL